MIDIKQKINCCGCTACSQICPKQCITMVEDEEGFKYPRVDSSACINCGLCEKVCPYLNQYESPIGKPYSFACKTKDDILRESSSSGGLFTVLANCILQEDGVVFGAKFDEHWKVVHGFAESRSGIAAFRGSKYAQSDLGNSFRQVKAFLKAGRRVLFTGTPCQVAGLNHFLDKKYDLLLTVDFVCHSVPSPKVWADYLKELGNNISTVTFRDKSEGWGAYGLLIKDGERILVKGSHHDNIYMKAFLSNLIVRPSCTNCPARHYKSGADITIADCWGFNEYHPNINDNKGMSLALLLTEKGAALYHKLESQMDSLQIPYVEVQEETNHNPIIHSPKYHPYREKFFKDYIGRRDGTIALMTKYVKKEEKNIRRKECLKSFVRRILGPKLINKLRGR